MVQAKRAFIFDMDGTIVDNMAFHTRSWITFFQRRGKDLDMDAFFLDTAGRQGVEIMRNYMGADLSDADNVRLNAEKEAVYRELYQPHLRIIDGFDTVLADASGKDVALAIATSAPDENIAFTLDGLDLRRHFHAVVGARDVKRGKPEPDAFLLAAERCGVAPEHCIVFEDAPLGVEAARRAGMRAVVLATTLGAEAFSGYDNVIHIMRDFSELSVDALLAA
jgi:beta-phosphoglucomutase family hydrolase